LVPFVCDDNVITFDGAVCVDQGHDRHGAFKSNLRVRDLHR
jgi:hypothetical protein